MVRDKEQAAAYAREYRKKHPGVKDKEKHRERQRNYMRRYNEDPANREYNRLHVMAWLHSDRRRTIFQNAKKRAKRDGLSFDLELVDIIIPEFCPILGIKLEHGVGKVQDCSPTLDKIHPATGYVRGNVWVISHRANTIKSNASVEELELVASTLRRLTNKT